MEPLAVSRLRAVFRYEGGARRLVHAYKFEYVSALAPSLATPMAATALEEGLAADAVAPVPLASGRERQRGFNQARLLAREVARSLALPLAEPLRRTRGGTTQAGSASKEARRANVRGAFALRPGARVEGRAILLVDDVATTGATLDACARVLIGAGAAEVNALTFARED